MMVVTPESSAVLISSWVIRSRSKFTEHLHYGFLNFPGSPSYGKFTVCASVHR
jgi:hypothetical protein